MLETQTDSWLPVGVKSLEPAAESAVRSNRTELVIAGPGAGKTELLAQRACYLLQTGLCRPPKRILAISFKRDAARNLKDRVLQRCGRDPSARFDSMTFDAFAKGLLDRFRPALPETWRPAADYKLEPKLHEGTAKRWLEQIPSSEGGLTSYELATLASERMFRDEFIGHPLLEIAATPITIQQRAASILWTHLLHHGPQSTLNFSMIGRLAELLLRCNPKVLQALRSTYAYVFLDEFQDTNGIQYELTKTAFLGSDAVLTAVGDNKQRIMGWAGALQNAFPDFLSDFGVPAPIRLVRNYRSAPELVRVLGYLTTAMDKDAVAPSAVDDGSMGMGECRVLVFEDHEAEARWLAESIAGWISAEGLRPRDICILTRMRPGDYTHTLRKALLDNGVEARVESELQDMLSEPISTIVLHALKLATRPQAPQSRTQLLDLLIDLQGGDAEEVGRRADRSLTAFQHSLRVATAASPKDIDGVRAVIQSIVDFLGHDQLMATFPQYSQGDLLEKTISGFVDVLTEYLQTRDWPEAPDAIEGIGSVPIMTMHKSKGLEYHTVVFVGFEDSALWSFRNSPAEETCGFFVALSRARKRAIFTFSRVRPERVGERAIPQRRNQIGELYELLKSAGVTPEAVQ